MKLPKNLAMILLAVWLILFGILTAPFLKFSFAYKYRFVGNTGGGCGRSALVAAGLKFPAALSTGPCLIRCRPAR